MTRAQSLLLGAWVVALGMDRVNLVRGLPFLLTPFLVLTPLTVASEWIRRSLAGSRVELGRGAAGYAAAAALLLGVVWVSVMVAQGAEYSVSRAALLTAEIGGTWLVAVLAGDRAGFAATLARGAAVAIALHAAASVVEAGALVGWAPDELRVGSADISLQPLLYETIPRLTGLVGDATRAGWTFLVLAWLVVAGERRAAVRRVAVALAVALIVMTLSRSALLASAATLGIVALTRRRLHLPVGSLVTACALAAALAGALYLLPARGVWHADTFEPLVGRFSTSEASAGEHLLLVGRGLDEATSSASRFVFGLGYGNAYTVLQDRFPGNPYGNFHSLYVTMLAESGIVALLCILVLIGWPLVLGGAWRPLVAGAAVLNVFYQINAEPAFWFVLALAWAASEGPAPRTQRRG